MAKLIKKTDQEILYAALKELMRLRDTGLWGALSCLRYQIELLELEDNSFTI
jgi:hypothetical protein